MRNSKFWRTCTWNLLPSLWVVLFLGMAAVSAGEPVNTTITSQKLTVRNQENKAIFEGAVVLTKGALVVHSDVMVVSFKPNEPKDPLKKTEDPADRRESPSSGQPANPAARGGQKAGTMPIMSNQTVSRIEATGKVRIQKEDGRATCHRAVYYADEEKIVLTGDPVAWEKGTRVAGEKITMFLAENRSVVEGQSRVLIESAPEGK